MIELKPDAVLFAQCQPPIALSAFAERMGVCPDTVLRWRDAGMVRLDNLNGKNFLLPEEVMLFNARLRAGEFAKDLPHIRTIKSRRNQPRR